MRSRASGGRVARPGKQPVRPPITSLTARPRARASPRQTEGQLAPSPLFLTTFSPLTSSLPCPRPCRCPVGPYPLASCGPDHAQELIRCACLPNRHSTSVIIKHAGTSHELTVDLAQPGRAFKQQIYEATGVPIDRCVAIGTAQELLNGLKVSSDVGRARCEMSRLKKRASSVPAHA